MNSKMKSARKASPLAVIVFAIAWILVGCASSSPAPQTVSATTAPAHSQAYNDLMTWKNNGGYAALQVLGTDLQKVHNPATVSHRQYSQLERAVQACKSKPLPATVDPTHMYTKSLRQFDQAMTDLQQGNLLTGIALLEGGTATMLDVKSRVEEVKANG